MVSTHPIILGSVPYLNVQPMLWAIHNGMVGSNIEIIPQVPRQLASSLADGQFDSAIVPVFEYFRNPHFYTYINGPVIAARGRVQSVMLFASLPWEQLDTVYLDASSLTSVNLFKVLCAENGFRIKFLDTSQHPVPLHLPPGTGWVLIGDPAIAQLGRHPLEIDLAFAWQQLTGLPFVFAAWLVPKNKHPRGLQTILNESLRLGQANLRQVADDNAAKFQVTPDFALRYFNTCIHYQLGEQEQAGWQEFGRLCHKNKLVETLPELRQYNENY